MLVETYDHMLHKLNIIDNEAHTINETKDCLLFQMINSGLPFIVANKGAAKIDYELIDRIMRGV